MSRNKQLYILKKTERGIKNLLMKHNITMVPKKRDEPHDLLIKIKGAIEIDCSTFNRRSDVIGKLLAQLEEKIKADNKLGEEGRMIILSGFETLLINMPEHGRSERYGGGLASSNHRTKPGHMSTRRISSQIKDGKIEDFEFKAIKFGSYYTKGKVNIEWVVRPTCNVEKLIRDKPVVAHRVSELEMLKYMSIEPKTQKNSLKSLLGIKNQGKPKDENAPKTESEDTPENDHFINSLFW